VGVAAPELVKIHPVTGELLERAEYPGHRTRNRVGRRDIHGLAQRRAERIRGLSACGGKRQPLPNLGVSITGPPFENTQVYREWFVPDEKNEWFADALAPIALPYDQAIPGLRAQPLFIDVYIPHDAAPGTHTGKIVVTSDGRPLREIVVRVQVSALTLPDRLNFFVDLNGYGGVNAGYNVQRGTPDYRTLVHAFIGSHT